MSSTSDRVRLAIGKTFPDSRVLIDVLKDSRLVVTVVSASFAGKRIGDRKTSVRTCLKEQLSEEDAGLVVNVLTDTPDEHVAYNETVRSPFPGDSK